MKRIVLAALAVCLAACSPPAVEAPAPEAPPVEPVITATSPLTAAQLVDCAGAIAAAGNVEIAASPTSDTPQSNAVWTILALLDKEAEYGSANAAKARADVTAARDAWKAKPPAELATSAASCTTRFPG
ncbi:MAG: hypothetical protein SGJ23_12435 [Alphaproteobacteria bacterium]|nr:hypothetical protein [Alphaproteobacteria bacterium]